MEFSNFGELVRLIAQYLGYATAIITAVVACSKKSRAAIKKFIKHDAGTEEIKSALSGLKKEMEDMKMMVRDVRAASRDTLRNEITAIYYHGLETKTIEAYKKESLLKMYDDYCRLGGNSYIKDIVENEIKNWKVV